MPSAPSAPLSELRRQHLSVETPEHVMLDFEIAGIGSRALAALIDMAILLGVLVAGALLLALLARLGVRLGAWASAALLLASFALWYGYFTFFEGLRAGQTPGKRAAGIRVVRDTGHPVTLAAAATRNLVRVADFLPPPYLLGTLLVALHPRAKRLGDMVAGTVVVRDRPIETRVVRAVHVEREELAPPVLTDEEYRLLSRYQLRAGSLDEHARARLAASLLTRFAAHIPANVAADAGFLDLLHAEETARRQGRLGARGASGSRGDQLAARQSARWAEFSAITERATRHGLDSLGPAELTDFAARYREIAADLARARTYHADQPVLDRLERLVAGGHNALYRDERKTVRVVLHAVGREFPAAVIQARRYVVAAFLAFALPAAIGYSVLRERPALAEEVLPQVMLDRAAEAKSRIAAGHTYAESEAGVRPLMASWIITNNVRIAFACFAGGIFAGVGSLVLLAFNGLSIGTVAGHFANLGVLGYLLEFIIGHGALELFAVWVAGAAGLLLGQAIVAPGELTRGDALVLAGRVAVRMIGAAVVCLLVAGLIEGFISASPGGIAVRAGASAASLLFLAVYLLNGWRALRAGTVR
jgi:uncharacterized membrane protein SpoIIM required for sporulation/uncharacterized RDD family membrane protein YckC